MLRTQKTAIRRLRAAKRQLDAALAFLETPLMKEPTYRDISQIGGIVSSLDEASGYISQVRHSVRWD